MGTDKPVTGVPGWLSALDSALAEVCDVDDTDGAAWSTAAEALAGAERLARNLATHAGDPKYRRVRKRAKALSALLSARGGPRLLGALGWTDDPSDGAHLVADPHEAVASDAALAALGRARSRAEHAAERAPYVAERRKAEAREAAEHARVLEALAADRAERAAERRRTSP